MPKVTYTVAASISLTVEMDEDLQDDTEELKEQTRRLLCDRLHLLDIYGGRTGALTAITIDSVQA